MRVPPKTWQAVFRRDNGICRYCEEDLLHSFSAYWSATVDHVEPVFLGGSDSEDNLVLACTACNGMLSRSKAIKFDDRKALVLNRRQEKKSDFEEWRSELRKTNDK